MSDEYCSRYCGTKSLLAEKGDSDPSSKSICTVYYHQGVEDHVQDVDRYDFIDNHHHHIIITSSHTTMRDETLPTLSVRTATEIRASSLPSWPSYNSLMMKIHHSRISFHSFFASFSIRLFPMPLWLEEGNFLVALIATLTRLNGMFEQGLWRPVREKIDMASAYRII
jgi:hypothetical protein